MKNVLVVQEHLDFEPWIVGALAEQYLVTVLADQDQFSLRLLGGGSLDVDIAGVPITRFELIIIRGFPFLKPGPHQSFYEIEKGQCLKAVLFSCPQVMNARLILAEGINFSPQLSTSLLCGVRLPSINWAADLLNGTSDTKYSPDKEQADHHIMVVFREKWICTAGEMPKEICAQLGSLRLQLAEMLLEFYSLLFTY
jgi:hypothetical protein